MGGCAGKNKSNVKKNTKDKNQSTNSSSLLSKDLPLSNIETVNDDTKSNNKTNDQPIGMNRVVPPCVISVSDSELEIELAYLVYGRPENEYAEKPLHASTFISTEV
ncbi:hypothetical protein I4U23_003069 [Adineta vaga]|nr:hypothetical protein I4U23_003069 [Adineta vaga]